MNTCIHTQNAYMVKNCSTYTAIIETLQNDAKLQDIRRKLLKEPGFLEAELGFSGITYFFHEPKLRKRKYRDCLTKNKQRKNVILQLFYIIFSSFKRMGLFPGGLKKT